MPRVLLEVAVASADDAAAALAGGADRLELNAALPLGGLTPSPGTVREVRSAALPLMVMARPRPGGFCYSPAEYRTLRQDIDYALANGADGIAFGILRADGTIDVERCRPVVEQVAGRTAVFHRAFDVTPDPFAALEQLIDLGVRRVMTSGQGASAVDGAGVIAELIRRAAGRIEVLPAAGINRLTAAELVARTGCDQVHGSFRGWRIDRSTAARPGVSFGGATQGGEDGYDATDLDAVAAVRRILDG